MIYALACEIRIAADTAVFTTAFAKLGLSGDMAAAALLVRLVGPRQARDLLLMPRKLTAAELLQRGLLTEIAAEGAFDQKANELLSSLSDGPPLAYAAIQRNLMAAQELPLAEAIDVVARNMVLMLESRDCSEPTRAFFL